MKLNNIVYSFSEFASQMAKLRNEKHFDYLVTIIGEDFGEEGGFVIRYKLKAMRGLKFVRKQPKHLCKDNG